MGTVSGVEPLRHCIRARIWQRRAARLAPQPAGRGHVQVGPVCYVIAGGLPRRNAAQSAATATARLDGTTARRK